ncbi:hypothetical protein ACFP9V_00680 [Deinococcus radiopugnans]
MVSDAAALRVSLAQPRIQRAAMITQLSQRSGRRSSGRQVDATIRLEAGQHAQQDVRMDWSRRSFGGLEFDRYERVGQQIVVTCLAARPDRCARLGQQERELSGLGDLIGFSRAVFVYAACAVVLLLSQARRVLAAPLPPVLPRVSRRTPQPTASGRAVGRVRARHAGLGRHDSEDHTPDA